MATLLIADAGLALVRRSRQAMRREGLASCPVGRETMSRRVREEAEWRCRSYRRTHGGDPHACSEPMTMTEDDVKEEIARIAGAIANGTAAPLPACRTIVRLRGRLTPPSSDDPDLLYIVAIESELDDVPSPETRALWAPDAYDEKQRKAARFLQDIREELLQSCRSLSVRWAAPGAPA